jgi:asparagine synthase (glutamine-hydrolysing)
MVSWPALPVLDRELLGLLGAMPMAAMSGRRLEADILSGRFPVLASLPLDRNSHNTQPISPRLKYLLADAVVRRLPWRPSRDVLYYERLADINSEPWVAVRREAEPYREQVEQFVDRDVLARLLPPPDTKVQVRDVIIENNAARLMLGLLLWSRECLP